METITFIISGIECRKKDWDGSLIRNGNVGVSGTEQTFVIIAEHFASLGHKVIICSPSCKPGIAYCVEYCKELSKETVAETNILVIVSWIMNLTTMIFPKLYKLIINFQCPNYDHPQDLDAFLNVHKGIRVKAVYTSEWTRIPAGNYRVDDDIVIGNPLMMDVINDKTIDFENNRDLSFVWHACWERGGHLAKRVFDSVNGVRFMIMDYYGKSEMPTVSDNKIITLCSADKKTVVDVLSKTGYFVYPLVLPNGSVHKDTFACCVAEAIALGVIVLTWPIAALPELYPEGNGIVYLPFPRNANVSGLLSSFGFNDMSLNSQEAVDIISKKIKELEDDVERKKELRRRGIDWARSKYNAKTICEMWGKFIFK